LESFLGPVFSKTLPSLTLLLAAVAVGIVALVYVLLRKSAAIPSMEVLFTTAHQANGALLVGLSALSVAWFRRWAAQSVPATGLMASSSASRA
jgi:hypothetical protein